MSEEWTENESELNQKWIKIDSILHRLANHKDFSDSVMFWKWKEKTCVTIFTIIVEFFTNVSIPTTESRDFIFQLHTFGFEVENIVKHSAIWNDQGDWK